MTEKRNSCYVWVTWLAKLMAGDVQCQWAPWFRSHYVVYPKAPSDFQQATWVVEHNKYLDDLCKGCATQSLSIFKESQNSFTAKRVTMTIGGKPDLIVLESDKKFTVYDVKTGQPKASDVIQVMLYMAFLPYSTSGIYKGKALDGYVVYKNGEKTRIPSHSVDDNFRAQITHFLNILNALDEPEKAPSYPECKFCDITKEDCPKRIESEDAGYECPDLPM
jgi:PD-(D/E)XK nuclease superfamily